MAGAIGTRRLVGQFLRPKYARFATTYPSPPIKLFTAWFCPFAQRCAIALEHHGVPYVAEEALGWTVRPTTVGEEGRAEEAAYHWKSPALLAANPAGMVPTLLDEATGRVVKESLVTVEFVDEYARAHGATAAASLMPSDPFGRADARVMSSWVNAKACSPYYSVLCKQDPAEQRAAFDGLVAALREFGARLEKRGAYFCGESLSLVDIALLPWANRYYVFEHYRGAAFAIPTDGTLAAYHEWLARCNRLAAVSGTTPDKDRYLEHIKKYATNTARSKVANAVRRGVAAHEYDDAKD